MLAKGAGALPMEHIRCDCHERLLSPAADKNVDVDLVQVVF